MTCCQKPHSAAVSPSQQPGWWHLSGGDGAEAWKSVPVTGIVRRSR